MSEISKPLWRYCRSITRLYPVYLERHKELHGVSMTANYTGVPGGSGENRATENVATRELSQTEQKSLDAVERAIRFTLRRKDGKERMRLIQLYYWPRHQETLRLKEVADKLYISEITAKRWHRAFILTVAKFRGLLD